jgi:steroid 5-alpha reductase family enzyme
VSALAAGDPGFDWQAFAGGLGWSATAAFGVMLATFAVALRKGVHRVVDSAWGIGFAAVALVTCAVSAGSGDTGRRVLVTVLTAAWGLRLAVHIARRGRGHGEDPRYERLLAKAPGSRTWYALRTVYCLQGALVWLVSLPVQAASYAPGPLGVLAWAGTAVWAVGLCFEAVGDAQLTRFKADPGHRGRIMDRGLWAWTRHPNYFGDFLVWWGLYLVACDARVPGAAAGAVSPLVMTFLLTRGSGKALLERHMAGRPGYAEYAARTSGFFPWPPGRGGPT